jgi:hypothetical protein
MASAAVQRIVIVRSSARSDEACEIVTATGHVGMVAWRGGWRGGGELSRGSRDAAWVLVFNPPEVVFIWCRYFIEHLIVRVQSAIRPNGRLAQAA